nr:MAG TPA: head tail connector [Caudoviricetes sp.]DAZ65532.1 MAG TPA: head tail connector [Caudoviricetes sp.]
MKVSELTVADIADYLRIMPGDLDETEKKTMEGFLEAAKSYVMSYTGLTEAEVDTYPDIVPAVCCLAGDFYTNRDMTPAVKGNSNRTIESILNMHSVNLL